MNHSPCNLSRGAFNNNSLGVYFFGYVLGGAANASPEHVLILDSVSFNIFVKRGKFAVVFSLGADRVERADAFKRIFKLKRISDIFVCAMQDMPLSFFENHLSLVDMHNVMIDRLNDDPESIAILKTSNWNNEAKYFFLELFLVKKHLQREVRILKEVILCRQRLGNMIIVLHL